MNGSGLDSMILKRKANGVGSTVYDRKPMMKLYGFEVNLVMEMVKIVDLRISATRTLLVTFCGIMSAHAKKELCAKKEFKK